MGTVTTFDAVVEIWLRHGIADPQGATIERALPALGYQGMQTVKSGKIFSLQLEADSEDAARARMDELCATFLSNPVIETHVVRLYSRDGGQ